MAKGEEEEEWDLKECILSEDTQELKTFLKKQEAEDGLSAENCAPQ